MAITLLAKIHIVCRIDLFVTLTCRIPPSARVNHAINSGSNNISRTLKKLESSVYKGNQITTLDNIINRKGNMIITSLQFFRSTILALGVKVSISSSKETLYVSLSSVTTIGGESSFAATLITV
jgi:hypothetical protein